ISIPYTPPIPSPDLRPRPGLLRVRSGMKRQRDHESGLVLSVVDRDRTPVRLHDRPRDVEPESHSPAFRARAKRLEDATALFGRNGTAIRHLCPYVRRVATSLHRDGSVGCAVLDLTAGQV